MGPEEKETLTTGRPDIKILLQIAQGIQLIQDTL